MYKPVVLLIFDGWGVAPDSEGNAVSQAKTPHYTQYLKKYPSMTLHAAGNEVGLFFGEIGNSEVGHLNIGAGRVYYQSCPRINQEIASGAFFKNPAFLAAIAHARQHNSTLHLLGLLSTGNVHSSNDHLSALLEICREQKIKDVAVHVILDGRDCAHNLGKRFVEELQKKMKELKVGRIASISGRFYAMDRDSRWPRIEKAYRAIAEGKADETDADPLAAIQASYDKNIFDEEFIPIVITEASQPRATLKENDAIIFFNFRADRAREITKALVLPGFDKFERAYRKNVFMVSMMEYEQSLPVVVAYEPRVIPNTLAEVVSAHQLKQFHIAETEKYAHVTFFLNGTIEKPFPGEDRALVPSPRVANYAEVPEMSAYGILKEALKAIDGEQYDLIIINFANADMVSHTGNREATMKACETIDSCLGDIVKHTLAHNGAVVVTADHGNAEEVINLQTGAMDREHSTNPVPLIVIAKDLEGKAGPGGDAPEGDLSLLPPVGVLADVAPTVLKLLGIEPPPEMTGTSLV